MGVSSTIPSTLLPQLLIICSGTGVGLVKDSIPAADIVRNTREAAKQRLQALRFAFDDEGKDSKDKSWVRELGHTLYKHK